MKPSAKRGEAVKNLLNRRKIPEHYYLVTQQQYDDYEAFLDKSTPEYYASCGGFRVLAFRGMPVYNPSLERRYREQQYHNLILEPMFRR